MVKTRRAQSERGQALLEYVAIFPLFVLLVLFVAGYAWWWWNQTTAAVALHDGARAAAVRGGNLAAGYAEVRRGLRAGLGRLQAGAYEGSYSLAYDSARRSVSGTLQRGVAVRIPFVGRLSFEVQAGSFQRRWRFYAGPPEGWD